MFRFFIGPMISGMVMAYFFGVAVGRVDAKEDFQKEAIKSRVAEYYINDKSEKCFRFMDAK